MNIEKRREELAKLSLDELADRAASDLTLSTNPAYRVYEIEFLRRQTLSQQEMAEAAKDNTESQQEMEQAAKDTAKFTQRNALYMLWSVIVLAIASVANLTVQIYYHLP